MINNQTKKLDMVFKTNNKKTIKQLQMNFAKSQYAASNKAIKQSLKQIFNSIDEGFHIVETWEVLCDGRLVGYALTNKIEGSKLRILGLLYTEPEYRGLGIASSLMEKIINLSELEEDALIVELHKDEVFEKKPFYKRFGFDLTAKGILRNNIALSNIENYEKLADTLGLDLKKAA
ncbi:GNAT family N-acetyltransferase [Vibrio sp. 1CM23M]|uniref:GNAT family N-acetyltransferase n=1 Tax=Vibrio sp. 1CM23M TaxID=2929164 RepID=UPI0020BD5B99|nr:GNAT family N-acetyltransferase [Vibrio sp. 1CM23M]MCK8072468.1 GNAT family N-acetyltransferase [Vibrio sp. 1CM23M]